MPAQRPNNQQVAILLAARIAQQIRDGAGKGLNNFRVFITARIKEELSVAAPRRRVIARDGSMYYVATTGATARAPPRKLSGTLRQRVYSKMLTPTRALFSAPVVYARRLELSRTHPHKFFEPVFRKYQAAGSTMIGKSLKIEMSARRGGR